VPSGAEGAKVWQPLNKTAAVSKAKDLFIGRVCGQPAVWAS
jgi:hypothetical protein